MAELYNRKIHEKPKQMIAAVQNSYRLSEDLDRSVMIFRNTLYFS